VKYSIDTSAILEGHVRQYPPDVFPALWQNFDSLINSGDIKATEEVLYELEKKDDNVYAWAKDRLHMFIPLNEEIQRVAMEILSRYTRLVDIRRSRTAADPFVIGVARLSKCGVNPIG
jgi:hypothetical protein